MLAVVYDLLLREVYYFASESPLKKFSQCFLKSSERPRLRGKVSRQRFPVEWIVFLAGVNSGIAADYTTVRDSDP